MKEKIDSAKHTEQIKILFSRFSHELRNPLALLSSELQLLASSHPQLSNDEQWENILENLEYIHALLDDMSRYQNAGQLSLVLTDLSPCLNEISKSFHPVLKYLEIEFKTDIPDNLPKLSLDPLKIRQVFLNLLRNAQESISHTHGSICFRAESTAQYVHISVKSSEDENQDGLVEISAIPSASSDDVKKYDSIDLFTAVDPDVFEFFD